MTIKLPDPSLADRVLKIIGKKRGVIMPTKEEQKQFGPHAYFIVRKESFIKALLRPVNEPLPDGLIDVYEITGMKDHPK